MKSLDVSVNSEKYARIMNEYFSIVPPDMFLTFHNFLFDENLTLAEKTQHFKQLEPEILKLTKLFKERVNELNRLVNKKDFKNYLEATLSWNEIPKKKYTSFLRNINKFVALVMNEKIPVQILMKEEKDWNIFNTPYPLGNQWPNDRFEIPNEVFGLLSGYDRRVMKYKDRLDIGYDKDVFYTSAKYKKEKNTVEIKITDRENDIYQVLSFVRAVGHAFDMLEIADAGGVPCKISAYLSKYSSMVYGYKFIKNNLSQNHQKVLRYNLLSNIASTLFEINVFTKEDVDYSKAYAQAINRCYPMTHQSENPFYIYYKRFLISPMGELVSTMIEMGLYLRDSSKG